MKLASWMIVALGLALGVVVPGNAMASSCSCTSGSAPLSVQATGSGTNAGFFETTSTSDIAVYAHSASSDNNSYAALVQTASGSSAWGLWAETNSGTYTAAIVGKNLGTDAAGSVYHGAGVYGETSASTVNYGAAGVFGKGNSNAIGVYGMSSALPAVEGDNSGTGGNGILGFATAAQGNGVYGMSTSSSGYNGVAGETKAAGASGVYGQNDAHGYGVYGRLSPSGTGYAVYGDNAGSTSGYAGYFDGRTNTTGCIQWAGTNEFGCTSDRRLKKNIETLTGAVAALLKLRGVTYEWKDPSDQGKHAEGRQTGFIAQEVEAVFPNWVDQNADGYKTLGIPPAQLAALEVEAIRSLKLQNDMLRDRVAALESDHRPFVAGLGDGALGAAAGIIALGTIALASRRSRRA